MVNTNRIDRASAEDQGFELANERSPRPYGILLYEDFNLFHVCIGAGLDPFSSLGEDEEARFDATARRWFHGATVVTDDHFELNRALVDGTIDFYVSGGIYTASPARLAGRPEVRAVTPRSGPIGGRGGIVFTEITSVLETAPGTGEAEDFLEYLLEPETARRVALSERTANPVAQMGMPEVFERFTARELDAIQWDGLEEDIARCADYDLMRTKPRRPGHLLRRMLRNRGRIDGGGTAQRESSTGRTTSWSGVPTQVASRGSRIDELLPPASRRGLHGRARRPVHSSATKDPTSRQRSRPGHGDAGADRRPLPRPGHAPIPC